MNNIREYILCRDDIFYFMEKYLKIELREFQVDVLSKYWHLETGKPEDILGCRGCGLTTVSCIYALWRALFYPGSNIAFYAPRSWITRNIRDTFCYWYQLVQKNWDETQKLHVFELTRERYIKFDNKSYIHFTHTTEQMRGNPFDFIFYDSLYLSDDRADVLYLTVPGTKKSVILTTY